jgi:hypothetical protein
MIRILHRKEILGNGKSGFETSNFSASISLLPKKRTGRRS